MASVLQWVQHETRSGLGPRWSQTLQAMPEWSTMKNLVTHHVYSVPTEIARKCCQLSDLHQPFGPHLQGFSRPALRRVAKDVFDCLPESAALPDEEALVTCILAAAAQKESHQLFMLQLSGPVVQGFVLLVPTKNLGLFRRVLNEACLPIAH